MVENRTILAVKKEQCTGCGACYNKCPVGAIRMEYDEEGFAFPQVDKQKCIQCGLCRNACPVNKNVKRSYCDKTKYFAVWGTEESRNGSSSGGMFLFIARHILELRGAVCGCRYTEDYQYAYHEIIESLDEIEPLRKSKYIQSEIREVYKKIENILKSGRWVLFKGTPCQVAGLYSYLNKEYEKLVTADIICHGVPSVKAYHKFLEENLQGREIEYVDFRDKSIAPWGSVEYIKFKDGSYYYNDCYKGMWYKAFLNGISTRKSCGTCEYANANRVGDLTLGDFWGISDMCPHIESRNGVSLVIANTFKGQELFKKIVKREHYEEVQEKDVLELAKTRNGSLLHPTPSFYARARFFEMLDKYGFRKAVNDTLNARYDIGIVGWWYNRNYGGALTYYALHQVLRKMGFSVLMIAEQSEDPNYKPDILSIPYRFALKNYYISRNHPRYGMQGLNEHCDVFISGSDQLFNPVLWQWSGPEYFLHFVDNNRKKISYASSFGDEFLNVGDLTEKMSYMLRRFDAISVREVYGLDIAKEVFGLEAEKVLDPVFLCDKEEYINLAKSSKAKIEKNYFVNFILDPNEDKRNIILYAEQKLQKDYVNLIHADFFEENEQKLNLKNVMADADIEEWIYYYCHSDFIITDSFHGTCFAIIFRKPFISIANVERGKNRFISLLTELGLMDRLVYDFDEIQQKDYLFGDVDYSGIENIINEKKNASLDWLYNAITAPTRSWVKNDFKLLDDKIRCLEEQIRKLENKLEER